MPVMPSRQAYGRHLTPLKHTYRTTATTAGATARAVHATPAAARAADDGYASPAAVDVAGTARRRGATTKPAGAATTATTTATPRRPGVINPRETTRHRLIALGFSTPRRISRPSAKKEGRESVEQLVALEQRAAQSGARRGLTHSASTLTPSQIALFGSDDDDDDERDNMKDDDNTHLGSTCDGGNNGTGDDTQAAPGRGTPSGGLVSPAKPQHPRTLLHFDGSTASAAADSPSSTVPFVVPYSRHQLSPPTGAVSLAPGVSRLLAHQESPDVGGSGSGSGSSSTDEASPSASSTTGSDTSGDSVSSYVTVELDSDTNQENLHGNGNQKKKPRKKSLIGRLLSGIRFRSAKPAAAENAAHKSPAVPSRGVRRRRERRQERRERQQERLASSRRRQQRSSPSAFPPWETATRPWQSHSSNPVADAAAESAPVSRPEPRSKKKKKNSNKTNGEQQQRQRRRRRRRLRTNSAPSLLEYASSPAATGDTSGAGGSTAAGRHASPYLAPMQGRTTAGVFGRSGKSRDDSHLGNRSNVVLMPVHETRSLHLRSEIMEHNITLGLAALSYLQDGCGLSPRRASEFVRPILLLEDRRVENLREGGTFTPLRKLALAEYGRGAFRRDRKYPVPFTPTPLRKNAGRRKTVQLGEMSGQEAPGLRNIQEGTGVEGAQEQQQQRRRRRQQQQQRRKTKKGKKRSHKAKAGSKCTPHPPPPPPPPLPPPPLP